MKKRVFGRQLSRDKNERQALFKGLMTSLILEESIQTTVAKAKAIRGQVEKLVTKAKKGQQAEYLLQPYVSSEAVKKLIAELGPRFTQRPGGYTRLIKLGNRFSDNAPMAVIEWVDKNVESKIQNVELKSMKLSKESAFAKTVADKTNEIKEAEIITEKPKATKKQSGKAAEKKETKDIKETKKNKIK